MKPRSGTRIDGSDPALSLMEAAAQYQVVLSGTLSLGCLPESGSRQISTCGSCFSFGVSCCSVVQSADLT